MSPAWSRHTRSGIFVLVTVFAGTPASAQSGHWLTGYYAIYNNGVMSTSQVDYTKLTHIIYWPVLPNSGTAGSPTGPGTLNTTQFVSQATFDSLALDLVHRAHGAGVKALIGVGGNESSGATAGFQISANPTYQATFIANIVALMQKYGFDGVDINWEQIQTSDNSNFTSFITNLRAALQKASPTIHLLLTMAPETKPNGGRPDLLSQVFQSLDQINIQTYQMSGPYGGWETWYNSPLNNGGATFISNASEPLPSIVNAIADYTSLAIPQSLLAMGIQFDAETWTGGQGTSTGGVSKPKQNWTVAPSTNTMPYRQMITTLAITAGYTTNFDATADQSWLSYDPSGTGTTNEAEDSFVSFDSPTSIAKKGVDMSPSAGVGGALGGVFIFELSGDYAPAAAPSAQHPLLDAAHSMQMLLPGLVTNLTATPGTTSVALSWSAANGATSYQASYSTSLGGTAVLAPAVSATMTTISNLKAGQEYWFAVQPVNAFGAGEVSPQVTATVFGPVTPTWATPASIAFGTPLSGTQLNATASVAGTFVYSPAAGTVLPVGTSTLTVTFTPASSSYTSAKQTVSQVVTAATLSTSGSFGSVNTGTVSHAHAIEGNIPEFGEIDSIQVLTLGTSGLDFQLAGGSTCQTGKEYLTATACTIDVTFTPTAAGTRSGAVVVEYSIVQGVLCCQKQYSTFYIDGTGVAPQITFDPGTATNISVPFQIEPFGVAVDGGGSVYFGDYHSQTVFKFSATGAATYAGGLNGAPYGLALDGAGNLFITESTTVVKVTPYGIRSTVATGLTPAPKGLAVGPSDGTLYIANTVANTIVKVTAAGTQSTFLSGTVLGTKLNDPTGLAVDIAGNVYIADTNNNRVLRVSSTGSNPALLPFTGLNKPYGIALGGTGNLYVADSTEVRKLTPSGVQTTVYANPTSFFAINSAEDLFISGATALSKLNRTRVTEVFAGTYVGSTSSDSPKSLVVDNFGNANLSWTIPASGQNPTATPNFKVGGSTTCPVLVKTSPAASLGAGQSCVYAFDFAPASAGAFTNGLTLTDNVLNVPNSQQSVVLEGTGKAVTAATVTLSGLSATYSGSPIAVKDVTSPAGLAVGITYNGLAAVPTKAGSYAVVATITAAGYVGSASGTLVISRATPAITWATPAPVTFGTALSATQLDAAANVAGTFVYTPAAGAIPAVGADTLSTTFTPADTTDYNASAAKVTLTVTAAAAAPRVVWVPDFDGGLLQVRVGITNPTAITINLPACNPNAVGVNSNKAYVVCSAYGGNPDKILVYNASTIRAAGAGTLAISPVQTITSAQFNSLIGITFDSSNDLWVASYNNNQVESIAAASLNTANPVVTVNLVGSATSMVSSPVSLAFDKNGSLWVVGQYDGGVVLNFPANQLDAGANAVPDYCLATNNIGAGCQLVQNVFFNPEGVALFNGDLWVSNNGGNVPGRELVDLKYSAGALTVNAVFGNRNVPADSALVCPGGMYGSTSHLWVNDESYGEANPFCGGNGDVASQTGGVFSFTPAQLADQTTTVGQILAFGGVTGRPGFGGIFIEND
jgi:GH18 family chitinase